MNNHRIGAWLGSALGIIGLLTGLYASGAAQALLNTTRAVVLEGGGASAGLAGAFAGLLVGSLCALLGVSYNRLQQRRAA